MASENETEKRETLDDVLTAMHNDAELYHAAWLKDPNENPEADDVSKLLAHYAMRIEAAWKLEREALTEESEDDTLVKSCYTCNHFQRKRKWCRVHDYSPHDPSKLPLIWPNGPCPQWECKYNGRGGAK